MLHFWRARSPPVAMMSLCQVESILVMLVKIFSGVEFGKNIFTSWLSSTKPRTESSSLMPPGEVMSMPWPSRFLRASMSISMMVCQPIGPWPLPCPFPPMRNKISESEHLFWYSCWALYVVAHRDEHRHDHFNHILVATPFSHRNCHDVMPYAVITAIHVVEHVDYRNLHCPHIVTHKLVDHYGIICSPTWSRTESFFTVHVFCFSVPHEASC